MAAKYSFEDTVGQKTYRKIVTEAFKDRPVAESLLAAIFERFKPFKPVKGGEDFELADDAVNVIDLMLGLNLLSRNKLDTKIKLMFKLCDSDDDGCMNPVDILHMLQKVERVFVRERSRIEI
jgi:hypothetical protein